MHRAGSALVSIAAALTLVACQAETEAAMVSKPGGAPPEADPAATAASGLPSEQRKFRDWIVSCDNGNACHAFGPAEGGMGFVRVAMQPGPDARPGVTVGLWPPGASGERELTITVDGRDFETSGQRDAVAGDPPLGVVQADAAELVRAMAQGREMTISSFGEATPVSLSGAAAAFLWIDERQGRLDTPTALIRRGDERPAGAVPPPPPLPRVPVAPAVGQSGLPETVALPDALSAEPGVRECVAEMAHMDPEFSRPTVARLADGVQLWGVPCFAGAYNFGTRYWITGEGGRDPRPAEFPTATAGPIQDLVNAGYDPETRTMSAFNKGRGIGDCGIAQTWVWSGRAFVLTAAREMGECWGVPAELWPTTWRTAE